MAEVATELEVRFRIIRIFPALVGTVFEITSEPTPKYNCIAWAAGDDGHFWWPGEFWPMGVPKKVTRAAFVKAFGTKGYQICDGGQPEGGFEKVCLYELNGEPTHAARMLPDGRWTSKLGRSHDIAHSLEGLTGDQYGAPAIFLRRPIFH